MLETITEPGVPCVRRLYEAVESALKFADITRVPRILKAGRLLHIGCLGEFDMKKSIADIKLEKGPPTRDGKSEDESDSCRLNDRLKV